MILNAMAELAVRFLALLGPISAFVVFERIILGEPLNHWLPLLVFAILVNAGAVTVAVIDQRRKVHVDIGNALEVEATRRDKER